MPLYITNFNYDNTILKTTTINSWGLQVLFYKQETGPFGFCSDEKSSQILKNIIINSLWYSIKSRDFYKVTESVFDENKYDFKGVLILIEDEFKNEIFKAKESIKLKLKNNLLEKYGKSIIKIDDNLFVNIYNYEINCYDTQIIEQLVINNKSFLIWHFSEFGGQLVFNPNTIAKDVILNVAERFNEPIIEVENIREIPAW